MKNSLVTVFGANGFLGHHLIRALAKDGWRIRAAVRRPHVAGALRVMGRPGQIQIIQANIRDENSVVKAVAGAQAVINLTSISHEQGKQKFEAIHQIGARTLARAARDAGISNMVHVSSLSADENAPSRYARSKARGEMEVRGILPSADIIRPALMVGKEGPFFSRFARYAQLSIALPLLGGGESKFAPVYVGDVAKAIRARVNTGTSGALYELAGPDIFTFKQLMRFTLSAIDKKRLLIPVPWFVAKRLGFIGEMISMLSLRLFKPILTRDQVDGLKTDTVPSGAYPGFDELGIEAKTIEAIIPHALKSYRAYGQFHHQST